MPPLALTMGEPAGIGPDITLQAWTERAEHQLPPFFVIACPKLLGARAAALGLHIPLKTIFHPREAVSVFETALPVLPFDELVDAGPGTPQVKNAEATLASIRFAVACAQEGEASAVVTNPIHKAVLYDAGLAHPGHTELLEELAGPGMQAVMMLAIPGLRVVPVTVHQSLAQAAASLTQTAIVNTAMAVAEALRHDFGIASPRLAIAGLNPHAGESGALGREEIEIIEPAIAQLIAAGLSASGPHPADTLFHAEARARYDAALCMYHDQALIPLKTLNFHEGVNITLGLPFVRTSPDHGTALDIAGTGKADPRSLIAALKTADQIARQRASTRAAA